MELTKETIKGMQVAINWLSGVNKDTGFPVYDLDYEANRAVSRTLKSIRPICEQIDEELKPINDEQRELEQTLRLVTLKEKLQSAEGDEQQAIEKTISKAEAEFKVNGNGDLSKEELEAKVESLKERRKEVLQEKVDVKVYTCPDRKVKCKGATPTPELLELLDPILTM